MSGDTYDHRFTVEALLTHEEKDIWDGKHVANYWLAPNSKGGTFILNLGCRQTFDGIQLVNTHNVQARDRASKRFRHILD